MQIAQNGDHSQQNRKRSHRCDHPGFRINQVLVRLSLMKRFADLLYGTIEGAVDYGNSRLALYSVPGYKDVLTDRVFPTNDNIISTSETITSLINLTAMSQALPYL